MSVSNPNLCPCGSGLRPVRCCRLDLSTVGPAEASRHLLPLVDKAIEIHAKGQLAEAAKICLEVLELAPSQGGALAILYQVRKVTGPLSAAEALIRRMVALDPNNVWATQELALLLFGKGDFAEAEAHARNAVRIAPADPQSHNLMGMILTEANRPQVGEYHYRRVIELLGQRQPILLANLAWNLKNQGKMAESRALYAESIAIDPTILQTVLGWARMEETDRDFVRANELLDQAETLAPGNPSILLHRAILRGRTKEYDAALGLLDQLEKQMQQGGLGTNELLEKGRLLDKMGRFDEAFAAFDAGKRKGVEQSGNVYLADHARQLTERLGRYFTASRLKIVPRGTPIDKGPRPLFIVGFPRSGTTMVEQTLSAHPRISAGDELTFVNDITNLMPRMLNSPLAYPEALADLWMGDQREGLDNLRDYYLQRARQLGIVEAGSTWFTDKMPLNETHLGLIGLMFPDAPIIHVLRHPLDLLLANMAYDRKFEGNAQAGLPALAQYYALHADMIRHFRGQLTLRYMPVRYEDLVADPAGVLRQVLGFIGAEVSVPDGIGANNAHVPNPLPAHFAGREPVHQHGAYKHRAYLAAMPHLFDEVRDTLAPLIEELGYKPLGVTEGAAS